MSFDVQRDLGDPEYINFLLVLVGFAYICGSRSPSPLQPS